MRLGWPLAWAAAGCAARPGGVSDLPAPAPVEIAQRTFGPGPWEGRGVHVDIPEGWEGIPGPAGGALAIAVRHLELGVRVEVWVFPLAGAIAPRPRTGCRQVFSDDVGSPRDVPGLAVHEVAACVDEDPGAGLVHGWYGEMAGREVHVEVVLPSGLGVEGRVVADVVLAGLRPAP